MSGVISPRNSNMAPYAKPKQGPIQSSGYVGFDSITKQIERKLLRRGFHFNIMCVGQTGLGNKGRLNAEEPIRQTTEIHSVSHVLEENGVNLKLNIVDTPGYGDLINNERCWDPIIKYIKDQHSSYLKKELTAQRDRYIQDTRVHCCLFFIQPSGHSLKPIDIIVLKKLANVVNVVPVIAKSDSLTLDERTAFKKRIREELSFHCIRTYPYDNEESSDEERALNSQIKNIIPFCIVGSEKTIAVDGKIVRGRQNLENENHCEFVYLRNFLARTHLQDLIETTAQIHYENFRSRQLLALKESSAMGSGPRPITRGSMGDNLA
ncbi:hypothetical protein MERGE_000713 [Pneumocystis wakefieldiae]|uniref:Septin-type G domain-containing protein n=1 Tax=Pneumocystis wakefieldiae TaxID=38082 RepID=A0A899G145_9ASCO|nr:hypothetical protein MERGE_000713 [Pneumocystis wakefieldiae]